MVSVERTFQVEVTASAKARGGGKPGVFEGWVKAGVWLEKGEHGEKPVLGVGCLRGDHEGAADYRGP